MATSVFTQCDGAVYTTRLSCADESASVFRITFGNTPDTLATLSVPVTGFSLEQQGNAQFVHTLNDFVYFYVFGDRVGELAISGIGFIGPTCPAREGGSLCELHTWYQANRVANSGKAMAITMNDGQCGSFWGFLTGMRLELPRADILVGQWVLRFNVLPRRTA